MSFKLLINLLDASKGFYLQIFNHLASYSISFHCKGKGFFRKQSSWGGGNPPYPPHRKNLQDFGCQARNTSKKNEKLFAPRFPV